MALAFQLVQNLFSPPQHADMGAKGLVGAEQIKINPQLIDVDQPMGGKRNPVSHRQGTGIVGDFIDSADIIHGAHNVGAKGKANQTGAAADQIL